MALNATSVGTAGASSESALPNPFTPMAFLPPDLAYQVTTSTYILAGTTGVIIWDVLNHLKSDYRLLTKFTFKITTIVYIISRLAAMGYVLSAAIFSTAPTGNCQVFDKVLGWLFTIAIPSSALLFLFRVKAVFHGNKFVVAFFIFTWLSVVAGCLTTTQGGTGVQIGSSKYCLSAGLASYTSVAVIIPVVNDTFVFLAISWRLMRNAYVDEFNIKGKVRTMVLGDYMPAFSKGMLKDGHSYYLTTVSVGLLTVAMLYVPGIPAVYRTMFTVPNIAIMNIMTCRVFRNTKFGKTGNNNTSLLSFNFSTTSNGDRTALASPSCGMRFQSSDSAEESNRSLRIGGPGPLLPGGEGMV